MKTQYESHHKFTIVRFRDGDTVEGFLSCRHCGAGTYETIRLLKIESWEPNGPDRHKAKDIAERCTQIYKGESGILVRRGLRRDKFGRLLNDVIINDEALSVKLVKFGYAWYGVGEPQPTVPS